MRITHQDKQDLMRMGLGLALFICALYLISFFVSNALNIQLDHAQPLVGSIVTVLFLLHLLRELISSHWKTLASFSFVILLVGAYGASTEFYVNHFTLLGLGELPSVYSWAYLMISLSAFGFTVYSVQRDFFN